MKLRFQGGVTTEGETIIYDLYEDNGDYIVYHSTEVGFFDYTTLNYLEEGVIDKSTYSSNTNNNTPPMKMYKMD